MIFDCVIIGLLWDLYHVQTSSLIKRAPTFRNSLFIVKWIVESKNISIIYGKVGLHKNDSGKIYVW